MAQQEKTFVILSVVELLRECFENKSCVRREWNESVDEDGMKILLHEWNIECVDKLCEFKLRIMKGFFL